MYASLYVCIYNFNVHVCIYYVYRVRLKMYMYVCVFTTQMYVCVYFLCIYSAT